MNNPLIEKAKYYLNESNRLSEELNTEIEYSAVLEAVLEELVGTEDFLKIMEVYSNPGSIEQTASGGIRSDKPGRNNRANVTKRIGQLGKILAKRQSKPGPSDVDSHTGLTGHPLQDDEIARDRQGVRDAALSFKTHGGQVGMTGNLIPSASNDNNAGIRMKDAKKEGVPVHVDPHGVWPGSANHSSTDNVKLDNANAERLARKSNETSKALQRPMPGNDEGEETRGQYAIRTNAEAAKKKRIAAGQDAATRSGMVTMPEHSNLVKTIMKFLVK